MLECCKSVVVLLLKAVESTHFNIKCSKEECWSKVLYAQNNGKLTSIYKSVLDKVCSDTSIFQFFHICHHPRYCKSINLSKNSKGNCGDETEKDIHISKEEEQTLYYAAEFIVFSMKTKYEKILKENPKSISASNALIFFFFFFEISKQCGWRKTTIAIF